MEEYYKNDRIWLSNVFIEQERARAINYVDNIPPERMGIEALMCDDALTELEEKGSSAWYTYEASAAEREEHIKAVWCMELRSYLINCKSSIAALDEEYEKAHETDEDEEDEEGEDMEMEVTMQEDEMDDLTNKLQRM